MNDAPRAIDLYVDFSSPYGYLATEWIETVAARHGRSVNYHAVLLGVIAAQIGFWVGLARVK
jgi:2-hydroxychromene-2-carboxylate isomerase